MNEIYRILLKQHVGKAAKAIVNEKQQVEKGELIAVADGLGADIHASVSGFISGIEDDAILVEPSAVQPEQKYFQTLNEDVVEIVKRAGIVGMGGAGFPTHIKLAKALSGGVVIANGVECEPVLAHNVKRMVDDPAMICKGLRYVMKAVNAASGIIAVKEKNQSAIKALNAVIKDDDISIATLPDLYPMGEERAVVREVIGRELSPEQLPSAANALICNVETLLRVAEAVEGGKVSIVKDLTVAGKIKDKNEASVFLDVPIGMSVSEVIERAGGIDGEYGEIIMGGPFTGKSVGLNDVITKTSGGIIVTIPFPKESRKIGLLVCACGAGEGRLREIAGQMGAPVAGVEFCKQAVEVRGSLKCENPGNCPGQAEKVLKLKKSGAEVLLISNCSDCSNTVMGVAPKLKMPVYHHTDHVMRTIGHSLVRRLKN